MNSHPSLAKAQAHTRTHTHANNLKQGRCHQTQRRRLRLRLLQAVSWRVCCFAPTACGRQQQCRPVPYHRASPSSACEHAGPLLHAHPQPLLAGACGCLHHLRLPLSLAHVLIPELSPLPWTSRPVRQLRARQWLAQQQQQVLLGYHLQIVQKIR
jgi:hypothetical protein